MQQLADMAAALRMAGATAGPTPTDAFRVALRQRLVAVATVQQDLPAVTASRRTVLGARVGRKVGALAGSVALLTGVAGVGVAAARSLPGNPFYDIKRATEAVQFWTAHGDLAKGRRHLEFARTRLAEARALDNPSASRLSSTLHAMDSQTQQGAAEMISAAQSSHSAQPITELDTFAHQQFTGLVDLARTSPAAAQAVEGASIQQLFQIERTAHAATPGCVSCTSTVVPPATGSSSPSPQAHPSTHPSSGPSNGGNGQQSPSNGNGNGNGSSNTHPATTGHSTPTQLLPSKLPTLPTKLPTLPVKVPGKPLARITKLLPSLKP
jgi:hypothetical protein